MHCHNVDNDAPECSCESAKIIIRFTNERTASHWIPHLMINACSSLGTCMVGLPGEVMGVMIDSAEMASHPVGHGQVPAHAYFA